MSRNLSRSTTRTVTLSSLRLWLSTNMPRDNDDSMFSLHISDRQESSRWRPRSNIGQTAFSNHKCIWELSAVRAPRHRRIRNTETKHGTKLRPSNFRPKNGTGSLQQQPCREKIGHEHGSSHWLGRACVVLFGIMSVEDFSIFSTCKCGKAPPDKPSYS